MSPYSLRVQPPLKALHYWDVLQTYHLVRPNLSCYHCKTSVFKNIYIFIFTSLSRAGWNKTKPLLLMTNPYPFAPTCNDETSSTTLYSQTRYLHVSKPADNCKHGKTKSFYKIPLFLEQCLLTEAKPHQFQLHQEALYVPDISKVKCK